MIKNYFIVAARNLVRNKVFSALTILGLTVGISASFILVQYNIFETSYDAFHAKAANIYRLGLSVYNDGELQTQVPKNFSALGPRLKADQPEILDYVRIFPIEGSIAIERNHEVVNEKNILFADASFLDVFSFKVIRGDASHALKDPFSIIITQSTANKYFKNEDPIGEQLTMKEGTIDRQLMVTAVVEDVPENSHLNFDMVVSHASLEVLWGERASNSWGEALFYTYILVAPGTTYDMIREKLTASLFEQYSGWMAPVTLDFVIQPLREIYLYSDMVQEARVNGSGKQVYFLWIIAVFIVILAWINYINLSTSRAIERAKEVGVRKVVGASKSQLIRQFMFESLLTSVISIILAFVIVQTSLPSLNQLIGKPIPVTGSPMVLSGLVSLYIIGSLLAAIVPSFMLSSFKTARVLKGKLSSSLKGALLRRSFVVFQFVISIGLLGGTFMVYLQLNYMRTTDLGADISQTLVLQNPDVVDSTFRSKAEFFKNELMKVDEITFAVSSSSIPGKPDNIIQGGLSRFADQDKNGSNHYNFQVDRKFIDAYKIKIIAGRNFSPVADEQSVLINMTACRLLGFDNATDAIGEKIAANWSPEKVVVGVVEDFHQQSLRSAYDPIVFSLDESGWGYYSIKLRQADNRSISSALALIEQKWNAAFPGNPFDYFFLDAYFNEQYKDDVRFGKVLNVFSGLTLFIACLGIVGLSIFNAAQRTKEIGVRKVLGASVTSILQLLSAEYGKMILIAFAIALPLTYHYIDKWLSGFVFHIEIQWWMLVAPGLVVLLVSLVAVSSQSIKAAVTNPVKSLKSE